MTSRDKEVHQDEGSRLQRSNHEVYPSDGHTVTPSLKNNSGLINLTGHRPRQARDLRHIVADQKQKHREAKENSLKSEEGHQPDETAGGEAKGSGPSSLGRDPRGINHIPSMKGTTTVTRREERTKGTAMKKREKLKGRDEKKNIATTEQTKENVISIPLNYGNQWTRTGRTGL